MFEALTPAMKQTDDHIWLVTLMDYAFDPDRGRLVLAPIRE
jgi:hypothetical protein